MNFSINKEDSLTRVEKGWGYELWVANKPEYCGKLLHFDGSKKITKV